MSDMRCPTCDSELDWGICRTCMYEYLKDKCDKQEAEIEVLRKVERRFSDELGFTDFAEGIGPVYATADQMIEQIRREREQSEEYWAEIERLRKRVTEQGEFIDRLTAEPQSQDRELEES